MKWENKELTAGWGRGERNTIPIVALSKELRTKEMKWKTTLCNGRGALESSLSLLCFVQKESTPQFRGVWEFWPLSECCLLFLLGTMLSGTH